jgi:glutamate:GABA antiporter
MMSVYTVVVIGVVATCAGIYYSFASPWIPGMEPSLWMTWVGSIAVGMFVLGGIVYFFGRRSAMKVTKEDSLAHLAVLDLTKTDTPAETV